jgi:20S proteasome subunit beta 7
MIVTNHPKNTLPVNHTQNPIIQGSSVIALKYAGGVLIATDTQYTFGSGLAKFFKQDRISKINNETLFTTSGELSDFQNLQYYLSEMQAQNDFQDDGNVPTSKNYLSYVSQLQYQRRNKADPFLVSCVIAGKDFLGFTDPFGTKLEADQVVTGMASNLSSNQISIVSNY